MRRALIYLVELAVLIGVAVWLSNNPGHVEIEWLGYHIETYFGVLLVLAGLAALVVVSLFRLLRGLAGVPGSFLSRRRMRRREAGYRALTLGMAAVAVGDRDEAKQMAQRADALLQDPDLTRLLSAQAASLNGDEAAARRYFNALSANQETAFLGLTGLMRQAMREKDDDRTLALAEQAHRIRPQSGSVVEILFDLQTRRGHWADAQSTLFSAVRRGLLTESEALPQRLAIFTARALEADLKGQTKDVMDWADKAIATSSGAVPAAVLRAKALTRLARVRKAARGLEQAWTHSQHPDIAAAYLDLWPDERNLERFRRLQNLIAEKFDDPTSRLFLASAALDAKIWSEARRNLALIDESDRSVHAFRLLARLEEEEHGDTDAARRWRDQADNAPPDPSWTCGSCGAVGAAWEPLCGNCGGFALIAWKTPPRVTRLQESPPAEGVLPEVETLDEDESHPNVIEIQSRTNNRQGDRL